MSRGLNILRFHLKILSFFSLDFKFPCGITKKKDALLKREINSSIKSCEIPDESGIYSSDGLANILTLRIYEIECCYLITFKVHKNK